MVPRGWGPGCLCPRAGLAARVLGAALGLSVRFSSGRAPGALPLRPDFVPQHKVGNEAQGDEEDPEDDEVQVELGILHVQLPQDGLRLLEVTGLVDVAVQVFSVEAVDGQDDPFKSIPEEASAEREVGSGPPTPPLPVCAEGRAPRPPVTLSPAPLPPRRSLFTGILPDRSTPS